MNQISYQQHENATKIETRRRLNFLQRELVRSQCTVGYSRPERQRQMRHQIRVLRGELAARSQRSLH